MLVIAILMFGAVLSVNMEKNENGNWEIATASASGGEDQGGENEGGGEETEDDCIHAYIVYMEGVSMRPTMCCQTEYQHYIDYYECWVGVNCPGGCPGRQSNLTVWYVGTFCCA